MPGLTDRTALGGLAVPARAAPLHEPAGWAGLARPGTPLHWVAVNAPGGRGCRGEPLLAVRALRLREAGVLLLGRLDCGFGRRAAAAVLADARRRLEGYRVGGFYLDRVPAGREWLADCRRLTGELAALPAAAGAPDRHLVLGHGTHPWPGYAEIADQLVTFDGRWSDYRWSQTPQWTAEFPPGRFCHLVHGVPAPHVGTALRIARWQGAGSVFITDRDGTAGTDSAGLPTYWDSLSTMLRDRPWQD